MSCGGGGDDDDDYDTTRTAVAVSYTSFWQVGKEPTKSALICSQLASLSVTQTVCMFVSDKEAKSWRESVLFQVLV